MSTVELSPQDVQCLRDYLEFLAKHRSAIQQAVQQVSPRATPMVIEAPEDTKAGRRLDSNPQEAITRYVAELEARGRRFVDQGGRTAEWIRVCQALRAVVLGLIGEPPFSADGKARSVFLGLGLLLDLMTTALNRLLADREQLDTRFRMAFEAAPTGLVIVDTKGAILFANVQTERMFGYGRDELIGQPVEILIPLRIREDHRRQRTAYSEAPTSRMMGVGRDLYGLRKDGSEFPVEIGLNPSHQSGEPSVLAVIADISERKRTEAALRNKMWELQRSNEDLEQFAYVASHDLQEPLRMVVSYTMLLSERYRGKLDEKADKFIRYAVEGATRMQQLVADLLAYSRVGSQGKDPGPVNAQAVLERTLDGMRQTIEESKARVVYDPLPMVLADDVQLAQLFQNLISNALKFHGEASPEVRISAQLGKGMWTFSVQDNGIGIAKEHSERIFQMFQRLHERGRYEGSGIGLTIAKKIVERQRGRLWFESTVGQGSTFLFTLPAVSGESHDP